MNIKTEYWLKPIPTDKFDYSAYDIDTYDGSEDSNTRNQIGYGRTEIEAIKEALSENDEILLVGFGRFIKKQVEARNGINPKTRQPIKIPAYMQPRFKAGIKLKEACNRNKKSKKQ